MRKTNYTSQKKSEAVTQKVVTTLLTDVKVNNRKKMRLSHWLVCLFIMAFSFNAHSQMSVTATGGTTGPTSYSTLKAAFDAINAGTHTGGITISVTGNSTETAQAALNSSGTGSASYTSVLIKPATGVTASISGSINTAIIKLVGADNVTIDGSNATGGSSKDLTIQNNFVGTVAKTGGTTALLTEATSGVIWLGSLTGDAATGNTIKNCNLRGSTRKNTYACIWSSNSSTAAGTAANPYPGTPAAANNNTITNNSVGYSQHGIRNNVVSFVESNWTVTNNTVDSVFTNGIFISNATGVVISNNTINSASTTQDTSSGTIHGIQTGGTFSGAVIANNKIVKVRQNSTSLVAAYSGRGMTLTSSTSNANNKAYNNQVCDVSAYGIGTTNLIIHGIIATIGSTTAASTTNPIWRIYNNSVNLTTPNTSPNNGSSAFSVSLAGATNAGCMDVKNNIFANNISSSSGNINYYAYFNFTATTANAFWGLDNNAYYTANSNLGSNNPSLIVNLAALRTSTGREANGIFAQPTFTSATDLHLSLVSGNAAINNGGTPLTSFVSTDIDGNSRSTSFPDMGADEIIYQPKVAGATPSSACAGGTFKIYGADLTSASAATLAGVAAASFSNINNDTVSAVVASGYSTPVTGTVSVTTSFGSSTSTSTVTRNAPGSISSQTLTTGSVGDQVRFTGTNLAGITIVTFNGTTATVVSSLAAELIVTVPAGATTGNLIVTDGCGNAINQGTFTVVTASACSAPTTQATSFTGTFTTSTLNGSYTAASGAPSGYLVVLSTSALSSGPANGTTYTSGNSLGGGTVRQANSSLNLSLTGLTGNTAYTVTIYSYNGGGCTGGPVYNTTSPLVYSFTTCSNIPNTVVATPNATGGVNNIVFTWAIPTEGGANARTYDVDVATNSNFTGASSTTGINALTTTVSNLNFATLYYYRIRTNNGCYSNYVTGSTTTVCGASSVLPYSQNFDVYNTQDLPASGSAVGCWTQENVNADAAVWKIGAVQGGGATIKSSPYCLRYDAAGTYAGTGSTTRAANDIAYTPGFILNSGTTYTVSFWQSNFTNGENLALKVYNGSAISTNFQTTLWTGTALRNTTPQYVYATFTPGATGTYYFGFHITSTAYLGNPSAISQFVDNVKVEVTPAAPAAASSLSFTNVASSSFTVNWTDNSSNEDFFDVYTSEDGVTYSLNQTVDANVTSASVTNQNSNTLIYVRVQARNSGGTSTDANGSVTTLSCGGVYTTNTFIGTLFAGTTVNWNLGGNWSLGHPPISCEDVVINANNIQPSSTTINYLYLNANATMHNLTITGANNPLTAGGSSGQRQALFIFTNGYKMDITGDLTISNDSTGGLAPATDNVLLTSGKGNGPIATGPITVYGTTTIGATGNRIASLGGGSSSGPGSITLKGDVVLGPQAFLNYGNLINYYFEKGGNQTLNITSTQGDDNTYGLGNLSIGSTTPTNLTITGTGTSRGSRVVGDLTIGANSSLSLPSGQNLNRSAPGGTFTMGSGATLNLSGSSSGATGSNAPDSFSVFSFHNTSTIVYNGTSMQSINAAYPYQNLTVNNAANVGLNGNTTVNNALTLTNGLVTTGSNQLTLGLAGSISGASSSRYINGTLAKTKAADVSGFLNFEIGDATQYAPVFIGFNGTTNSGGTFSAKTVSGMPSALGYQHSGISTTDYLNRKYTLNNTGITGHTSIYTKFSYANGDMISGGTASNNNYNIADSVYGSGWAIRSAQNASDPYSAATVSLTSGQTADYLIGNPDPAPAPTVDPLSSTTVCEGSSFLITGTNFYAISDVKIGSTSVSYTVNSPTQITITIPVGFGNGAVTVTNATNFATTSNSLTTLDQPQTTVTPSSQTICSGSALTTIVAGNSNSVPSTTYTWTRTGSNISGGTNTASGTGNVSGTLESSSTIAETITYSVVGSANGCTGTTAIATVTLKAAPGVANVSPSSSSICQNTILQLDGSYTAATGSSTKNSTGTSAIPDGSIAGVFNQVSVSNIPTGAVITRIDVNFDITHTYNGDLAINLTAPNGKTLNLVAGAGDAGANFVNTTVSSTGIDAFPATTTNNITGVYAPDAVGGVGPVTALSNASTFSELYSVGNGVWKLGIRDYGTPDAGTLTNWSIKIYYTLTSTFSWAPTAGLYINSGATTPYTGGTQQTVYVKNTPGSYSYKTLIASNGCTDSSSAANVEIEAVPVVTRNIASQTVCSGVNISDIVFSSSDLSASITWSRDETTNVTGIADNGTTGTISGALVNATAAPITVTFTGTATGNGASACAGNTVTATVTVNPIPLASVSPSSQNACSGSAIDPLIFLTTNGVAGTTFAWTRDNTTAATGIGASGTAFVSGTLTNASDPTTVTFYVTAVGPSPAFCAGAPTTATVNVMNPASAYAMTGGGNFCSPAVAGAAVGVANSQSGYNYQLYKNGVASGSPVAGTGSAISFGLQDVGVYTAIATNGGCNTNMTGSVTVTSTSSATPTISISTATSTVCSGSNVTFSSSITNGGSTPSYAWKKNGTTVSTSSSYTFASGTLNTGDQITCVLTSSNSCVGTPITSNTITLTVNPSPAIAPIKDANGASISSKVLCTLGTSSSFNLYCATNGGTWSSSSAAASAIASSTNPQSVRVTAVSNGTAIVSYTLPPVNGCSSSSSVVVKVSNVTTPDAVTGSSTLCVGSSTPYSTTSTGGVWSTTGRATITTLGAATGTSAGSTAIRYTVTNADGCSAFSSLTITVNAQPAIPSIAYAPGTTSPQGSGGWCANRTFNVVGNPTGGVWSKTGVMSISVGGACATGPSAGPFSVSYTVTNSNGCTNARTIAGNVVLCPARGITNNSVMTSDNNFTMYPNPANNVVKIDINKLVGNGQIIVTDMLGKQVVKQSLSIGMNNVDISKLTKGFYMVSIVTSEGKTTKKLIKE